MRGALAARPRTVRAAVRAGAARREAVAQRGHTAPNGGARQPRYDGRNTKLGAFWAAGQWVVLRAPAPATAAKGNEARW